VLTVCRCVSDSAAWLGVREPEWGLSGVLRACGARDRIADCARLSLAEG